MPWLHFDGACINCLEQCDVRAIMFAFPSLCAVVYTFFAMQIGACIQRNINGFKHIRKLNTACDIPPQDGLCSAVGDAGASVLNLWSNV